MNTIIWLFPILFMLHDFEEIIFLQSWIKRNESSIRKSLPSWAQKLISHLRNISTAAFCLGVAEEFFLITIVTIRSFFTKEYFLWLGLFIVFTIHLVVHCFQSLILKKYIPAVFTSILLLPICIQIICYAGDNILLKNLLYFSFISIFITILNLVFIHYCIFKFDQWLLSKN